jgi:hypothetical protein
LKGELIETSKIAINTFRANIYRRWLKLDKDFEALKDLSGKILENHEKNLKSCENRRFLRKNKKRQRKKIDFTPFPHLLSLL